MHSSRGSVSTTHILYANDVLHFCKASAKNVKVLEDFFSIMGMSLVNWLIGINLLLILGMAFLFLREVML